MDEKANVNTDEPLTSIKTSGNRFQRVDPTAVKFTDPRLADNSYEANMMVINQFFLVDLP